MRAVFYVPYILPGTAIYIAWNFLYQRDGGLFNIILGNFGFPKTAFMASSQFVIPALALIAVWTSGNLIVIFLAGLQNVPRVYIEAAEIDGAGPFKILTNIIVPAIKLAIIVVALLLFITLWNDLLQQTVYIGGRPEMTTIAIGLTLFVGSYGNDWNYMMAATFMSFAPGLIFYLIGQRHFVEGIVLTGMKN